MNIKIGTVAIIVAATSLLLGGGFCAGFLLGHFTTPAAENAAASENALASLDRAAEDSTKSDENGSFWGRFGLNHIFSGTQYLEGAELELAAERMALDSDVLAERLENGELLWDIALKQGLGDIDILVLMFQLVQLQLADISAAEATATPTPTATTAVVYQALPPDGGMGRPNEGPGNMNGRPPGGDMQMGEGMQPPPLGAPPELTPTPTVTPTP